MSVQDIAKMRPKVVQLTNAFICPYLGARQGKSNARNKGVIMRAQQGIVKPSRHTTLKWCRINVDATWSRRIDVDTTSFWCCVPTGKGLLKWINILPMDQINKQLLNTLLGLYLFIVYWRSVRFSCAQYLISVKTNDRDTTFLLYLCHKFGQYKEPQPIQGNSANISWIRSILFDQYR